MTHHFELAQGSRRSTVAATVGGRDGDGSGDGARFIDGGERLGETLPTELLQVHGYTELSGSQFIRLSRELGSVSFPDLRGKQLQLLKELCLVAKCSEEFFLSVSKDQWLRTTILCRNKDSRALFSSEVIEQQCHTLISGITIHSNVIPRHPYWSKLQAVRDGAPDDASKRVYFPSTFLDLALSGDMSLAEKLNEWEDRAEECAIGRQSRERDDDLEQCWRPPFWRIGPEDVEVVNSNFVEGGQAAVWKISWRGGVFARKVFKDNHTFEAELEVVRRVSHPHIVYSFGVSMYTDATQQGQHSLLMELLDRDLFALIEDRVRLRGYSEPPFSRLDSVHILLQVAEAMAYVHSLEEPVIHGDLKPQNILVSHCEILGDVGHYFVKVADFGSAKVLKPKCSSTFTPAKGTTKWAAPEVLSATNAFEDDPKKIDVYSFGIVAFQILSGLEPYEKFPSLLVKKEGVEELVAYEGVSSRRALREGVIAGTLRPPLEEACSRPNFWSDWPDLMSLIVSCWQSEPSARPHFAEVANRLKCIYNKLNQEPLNGSHGHPPLQANLVDDAPQSSSTRNGLSLPEVNQVNAPSTASQVSDHDQVRPQSVQEKPRTASRWRKSISRHLLSCTCVSPGKTIN